MIGVKMELPIDDIIQKYLDGESYQTIAKDYNCSSTVIANRLKNSDNIFVLIRMRNKNSRIITTKLLVEEFMINGLSVEHLANKYDRSVQWIENKLCLSYNYEVIKRVRTSDLFSEWEKDAMDECIQARLKGEFWKEPLITMKHAIKAGGEDFLDKVVQIQNLYGDDM